RLVDAVEAALTKHDRDPAPRRDKSGQGQAALGKRHSLCGVRSANEAQGRPWSDQRGGRGREQYRHSQDALQGQGVSSAEAEWTPGDLPEH
ncbi:hypothetical protein THAOC_25290, partial [Thalassiosira oceanica]